MITGVSLLGFAAFSHELIWLICHEHQQWNYSSTQTLEIKIVSITWSPIQLKSIRWLRMIPNDLYFSWLLFAFATQHALTFLCSATAVIMKALTGFMFHDVFSNFSVTACQCRSWRAGVDLFVCFFHVLSLWSVSTVRCLLPLLFLLFQMINNVVS